MSEPTPTPPRAGNSLNLKTAGIALATLLAGGGAGFGLDTVFEQGQESIAFNAEVVKEGIKSVSNENRALTEGLIKCFSTCETWRGGNPPDINIPAPLQDIGDDTSDLMELACRWQPKD